MSCPRCGAHDAWEDNFYSGCDRCGWRSSWEHQQRQEDAARPRKPEDHPPTENDHVE